MAQSLKGEAQKVAYTLRELVQMNITKIPFLLEDVIPQNVIGMITGPSETNKSTFARLLSYSIITGQESFLGIKLNVKYKKVLFVSTEDNSTSTAATVRKQLAQDIPEDFQDNMLFLFGTFTPNKIKEYLGDNKVDLIILDTWTDTFSGNINDSISVRQSLKAYGELCPVYDCTLLGIHHSKKGTEGTIANKSQMLGSQAIEAYARVVLDIRKENANDRTIKIVKGNYTSETLKSKPFRVRLDADTMQLERLEESGYGFANIRVYSEDDKEAYVKRIKELQSKGMSLDKIKIKLAEEFPEKKTPAKGSLSNWLKEETKAVSQLIPIEISD